MKKKSRYGKYLKATAKEQIFQVKQEVTISEYWEEAW